MTEKKDKVNSQLYTLNLTVVALVALVAIVGLTAIVLNGGSVSKTASSASGENQVGSALYQGHTRYLGPPQRIGSGGSDDGGVRAQEIIRDASGCEGIGPVIELKCANCVRNGLGYNTETRLCVL